MGESSNKIFARGKYNRRLEELAAFAAQGLEPKTWPTPRANSAMAQDVALPSIRENKNNNLETAISKTIFPTPAARDWKGKRGKLAQERKGNPLDNLPNYVDAIPSAGKCSGPPPAGALNPDWVEWLMGWPIGWSSLDALESDEILSWDSDPSDDGGIPRVTKKATNRAKRLKAIGNGQVPKTAATAWMILSE
jgi:DNA (cytosine-5)-methyltransferase 1